MNSISKVFNSRNAYKCKIFFAFFMFLYFGYALFMNQTFDSDHMSHLQDNPFEKDIRALFKGYTLGGRPMSFFIYLFDAFWFIFGIKYTNLQLVFQISLIFFLALGCTVLYFIYMEAFSEKDRHWVISILCIGVVAPFYVEVFVFSGPTHGIGFLLAVLGIREFIKKRYIRAFLMCFLAVGTYQTYYEVFLIYGLAYICLNSDEEPFFKTVKKYIALFLTAGMAAFMNLLSTKLYSLFTSSTEVKTSVIGNATTEGFITKFINLYKIYALDLQDEYGVLPHNFLLFVLFAFIIMAIISSWHNGLLRCVVVLVTIGLIWLIPPSFTLGMNNPYMPARTYLGIFWALSATLIICFKRIQSANSKMPMQFIAYCMIIIYLLVDYYSVQTTAGDVLITNKMEFAQMRMMQKVIDKYENETGKEIMYVAVAHYPQGRNAYDEINTNINYIGDPVMHMITHQDWSDVTLLNYVTGRNYVKTIMTEEQIEEYFEELEDIDFSTFDPNERMVFCDDTLYWVQY